MSDDLIFDVSTCRLLLTGSSHMIRETGSTNYGVDIFLICLVSFLGVFKLNSFATIQL